MEMSLHLSGGVLIDLLGSPRRPRDFLFPPTVLTTKNYNGANDMSLRQNGQRAQSHSNGQRGVERGPQGGEELSSKTQTIQTMM